MCEDKKSEALLQGKKILEVIFMRAALLLAPKKFLGYLEDVAGKEFLDLRDSSEISLIYWQSLNSGSSRYPIYVLKIWEF